MSAPLFTSFFADYDRSIKNRIVEEGYDLYFSRPLGFIFAKWLSALKLSPTNISVVGMLIGVSGGVMLSQQNVLFYTALGGLLVTFAGILDSSDGQAARLYNTHTEMGRYLDMFNDMLVFIACYAGGLYYFVDTYTWYGFWGLGLLSGYMHSLKSNIYEYYKGEFLHFSLTDSKNRNYSLEYIR
ncbi:CDP-alcohol phosphatidyltransferase family protein, partial [Balneolaceae bacterium]|nr:CDP-alcohol phosphatidyltransferase family protein [Balneolaceae bacterium]